ncbi:MAG: 3-oxoacid CoA-transferase subunit A [Candidatus Wallbacteria bacterium]|nr:3-oxoacid CoA-transferase subunit A [Candidatus Wallbacteria bacterium]
MKALIGPKKFLDLVPSSSSLMVGGFLAVGTPEKLVGLILDSDKRDFTVICNDSSFPDKGVGRLIAARKVRKIYTSHIGTNPETGRQFLSGEIEVELNPQGTLAERIRAFGAGLGGVLTPTGIGTELEKNRRVIEVDGRKFLLETPLRADVALLKAHMADRSGNLVFRRSARNFNPLMALAADVVIVEAELIVETGSIDPDQVMTPGILVDYIFSEEE